MDMGRLSLQCSIEMPAETYRAVVSSAWFDVNDIRGVMQHDIEWINVAVPKCDIVSVIFCREWMKYTTQLIRYKKTLMLEQLSLKRVYTRTDCADD
ncbi:hypothetical protein NDU88_008182 [Pleurodeles waltl]|uniref:Uncharacterized protein n=1 Tax=Pleurodeles waltl TaxID=8319 RepID=A0AAV7PR51_PLEWA|nr:hypothetical protein NDU88_008182 [Pleurodeles waltl]